MLSCTYEVVAIDGDYAHLRRNDIEPEDNETKLVARALLPPEIMEGSILKYEMLQYGNSNARIYRIRWRFCCLYVSYSSIFIPIQHFSRLI